MAPACYPGRRDELDEAMSIANHDGPKQSWNCQGPDEQALFAQAAQAGEGGR